MVVPYHQQIAALLRKEIQSGRFKQGDPFATEKQLAERFGLSSTTIKRAIQTLVQEGYLHRVVAKGTFVRRTHFEESLGPLCGFFDEMESKGLSPTVQVLISERQTASPTVTEKLQLDCVKTVYWIRRLHQIDSNTVASCDSYFSPDVGSVVSQDEYVSGRFTQVVQSQLGIHLRETEVTIEAAAADAEVAGLLNIPQGTPVLIVERVMYAADGRPVWMSRYTHRSDRYRYRTRMIQNSTKRVFGDDAP